jgi:hypothetical protein
MPSERGEIKGWNGADRVPPINFHYGLVVQINYKPDQRKGAPVGAPLGVGRFQPCFCCDPCQTGLADYGRNPTAPNRLVNRPISHCNIIKKDRAVGRGQFNREEVDRKDQHGLPIIAHVE